MNKYTPKNIPDGKTLIIGAGLSGVAYGYLDREAIIIEKDLSVPKIPQGFFVSHKPMKGFKEVKMQMLFMGEVGWQTDPTPEMIKNYQEKIYGKMKVKASAGYTEQFEKMYLPESWDDFYEKMLNKCNVCEAELEGMNRKTQLVKIGGRWIKYDKIIFTIPLIFMLDIAKIKFEDIFEAITFRSITVPAKYHWQTQNMGNQSREAVIYDCRKDSPFWRFTAYHDKMMIEYDAKRQDEISEERVKKLLEKMRFEVTGKMEIRANAPGKIVCKDEELRKKYLRILAKYKIFPVGRYAAWKKKYYFDDSLSACRKIIEHFSSAKDE